MVFKRLFKDKQSDTDVSTRGPVWRDPLVHQLLLRLRGTFDLDEILQLVAHGLGEQLKVDHCLVYLCDPSVDTLRWRAGYQRPELAPLRWPLRESDFPDLFTRLRKPEIVRVKDPLQDSLLLAGRNRFESAGVRSLVFVPAFSEQLEAVIVLGQNQPRLLQEEECHLLEEVASVVTLAARHMTLSSALRRAGTLAYSATAELQTENHQLQGLIQLLLLPPADLPQVLNHISETLCGLYRVKACSIEELQPVASRQSLVAGGKTVASRQSLVASGKTVARRQSLVAGGTAVTSDQRPATSDQLASDQRPETSDQLASEERPTTAVVRSMCLAGRTVNLGVFPIEGTPRKPVVESAQHRVVFDATGAYPEDQFLTEHDLNFYAGVPIVNRAGELIGLLNLFHQGAVNLQKRDLKTLLALARRIGSEIDEERSARARAEAEHEIQWRLEAAAQWEEQLKFLREARELLRTADGLEAGLQELVISANLHMGSDFAAIALYEKGNAENAENAEKRIENLLPSAPSAPSAVKFKQLFTAGIEPNVREAIGDLPTGKGLLGMLIDWTGPLRLDNLPSHPQFTGFPVNHPVMRSFLAVPLRVRGATVGAIYFADKNGGESFSNEDELFATELAAQIAVAVAAPVFVKKNRDEGMKGQSDRDVVMEGQSDGQMLLIPSSLYPSIPVLSHCSPMEKVCDEILGHLADSLQCSHGALFLYQPEERELRLFHHRGLDLMQHISLGKAAASMSALSGELQPLIIPDIETEEGEWGKGRMGERENGTPTPPLSPSPPLPLSPSLLHPLSSILGPLVEVLRAQGLRSGVVLPLKRTVASGQWTVDSSPCEIATHISRGEQQAADSETKLTTEHCPLTTELVGLLVLASPEPNHFSHYSHEFFSILTTVTSDKWQANRDGTVIEGSRDDPRQPGIIPLSLYPLITIFTDVLLENLSSGVVAVDREGHVTVFNPAMERLTGYRRHQVLGQKLEGVQGCRGGGKNGGMGEWGNGRMGEWENGGRREWENGGMGEWDSHSPTPPLSHSPTPPLPHSPTPPLSHSPTLPLSSSPLQLFTGRNLFDDALVQGRVMRQEEVQVFIRGGGKKYVSLTVTPLCDEQGALAGAVGIFTDITELRALEHERYRLTPLALIGEMSARLAHEIKNPLASMMSGLELLKRRAQVGEREAQYFERLIAELQRLDTTVREMLAYSHTTPPALASVDPADPLERALETLMPQLDARRVQVLRDYQLGLSPLLMDANQMEQVFLNLIINAIHAMPDGGTLAASLRTVSAYSETEAEATLIEYTISDTGVGISPDVIDKIFDPFFSTKTHGTGLGLASVQKIIETHQGQISVESEPGQGATFTIRLKQQPPGANGGMGE